MLSKSTVLHRRDDVLFFFISIWSLYFNKTEFTSSAKWELYLLRNDIASIVYHLAKHDYQRIPFEKRKSRLYNSNMVQVENRIITNID